MRKYATSPAAAAVPIPGATRPASSPTAAEPRRIANGTVSDRGMSSRWAVSVIKLAWVRFR
jgi:hypothetical protein